MATLLSSRQLSYGVRGGAEAAVHAARKFLQNLEDGHALVKQDFTNAFNSIRRNKMLEAVPDLAPSIHPLAHSAYSTSSSLLWDNTIIKSAEGVQQRDPLGPLLFCLAIQRHCSQMMSPLCLMYLDDVTISCAVDNILPNLEVIKEAKTLDLT